MFRFAWTSLTQRTGGRWRVLLFALLLALSGLVGHVADANASPDCPIAVEWMSDAEHVDDHGASHCLTCPVAVHGGLQLLTLPDGPALPEVPASIFRAPLPPRRPPRA
ncbi:MAG TPA: hypothetical protein VLO12_09490 [Halomonas sp.]|nr:hypothetical protein [Halomonas sp.]